MTQQEIEALADAHGIDGGGYWEFGPKALAEFVCAILATAAPTQAEPSNQPAQRNPECGCRKCNTVEYQATHFIVCEHCGNKRCPHASNHRYACTNSNEPGQAGSVY